MQYESFDDTTQFVKNPATLTEYDAVGARLHALVGHRGVDDLVDRLDSLTERLFLREDTARTLRKELGQQYEELARATHRIEALDDELNRSGNQIERLDTEVAAHRQEISRLEHEAQALYVSKSWRWMTPLRAIHRLVHRR